MDLDEIKGDAVAFWAQIFRSSGISASELRQLAADARNQLDNSEGSAQERRPRQAEEREIVEDLAFHQSEVQAIILREGGNVPSLTAAIAGTIKRAATSESVYAAIMIAALELAVKQCDGPSTVYQTNNYYISTAVDDHADARPLPQHVNIKQPPRPIKRPPGRKGLQ